MRRTGSSSELSVGFNQEISRGAYLMKQDKQQQHNDPRDERVAIVSRDPNAQWQLAGTILMRSVKPRMKRGNGSGRWRFQQTDSLVSLS